MATIPNVLPLQTASGSYSGAFTATVPSTTAASSLSIFFSSDSSASTNFISGITGGGTWSRVLSIPNTSNCLEEWNCPNCSASVTSLVVSVNGSPAGEWVYAEIQGIVATSPVDQTASATGSGTSGTLNPTTGGSVAQQVELVLECDLSTGVGKGGGPTGTPSGYALLVQRNTGGAANKLTCNYKIRVKAVGTETASVGWSSASSSLFTSVLTTFKAVANVIQQTNIVSGTGTTATVTVPLATNTGVIAVDNTSGGASSITQTGNTWTKISGPIGGTNAAVDLWYSKNMSGSASSTITFGNSVAYAYTEIYGLSTTAPLDKSVTSTASCGGSTTTNATTGTTGTTSNNPQMAIAGIGMSVNGKGGTWSLPLNGYVSLANTTSGGNSINMLMLMLTSNTTTSTGATLSPTLNTNTYGTVLATFQETQAAATAKGGTNLLMGVG